MSTADRDWIREGAKVALYKFRAWGSASVTFTTVERLTGTQIILADHPVRYRRDTLHPVGRSRYDEPDLLRADDPKVIEAAEAERLRSALHGVKAAAEKVRTDHGRETAAPALAALAQAVDAARKLIAEQTDADTDRAAHIAKEK